VYSRWSTDDDLQVPNLNDTGFDGMQVLFSTVFAFSVNLLQLVILEVLGTLDHRFV